ncbi:flagellar basal body P-ring protein FlgI [Endozoicomonas numazuensis]|uniref:Flagellar P-ring protein n=1 Tax=Endozoicomonas numazuensis TaxID=1137799 RepID=A0A081ND31_9GAMM|nr:flagellar basal body P-ring protein FlgI [Endozoicomonas numazuensis]KEQ16354.1 flagellar P-ring protein FlgI [Endozoicomonas numazuensis]
MKNILPILLLLSSWHANAERLLDLVDIQGVRSNQLIGYGLVVGLDGTGDSGSTEFTNQSLVNMLREFGITLSKEPSVDNVAAVSVHAELPAFVRPGQKINVTVSSIGDAKSIRGGALLMTSLKGIDGEVYAIAQGNVLVGGASASGASGSRVTINSTSAGIIPNGAIVERTVASGFNHGPIVLNLRERSFSTARTIASTINKVIGPKVASAVNGSTVEVQAPSDSDQRVTYMAMLEDMQVEPSAPPARVIFNSRTGTVVMGQNIRVLPAAVSHGSLVVTVRESTEVSQPNPFGQGTTTAVDKSDVQIEEQKGRTFIMPDSVSLQEIVTAINSVGATPTDLMSILQALKAAGALRAELIVI